MAKKSIKKLWKEKAQGKYHIGCIFPNDTPYGKYSNKKCYLSKVKKNGEYEFTLDHTYAKDFSEQKADEYIKKLQDEFGGKVANESMNRKRINESARRVWWDADSDYDYWENEASDEEVINEFKEREWDLDDYQVLDDEDEPVEGEYDVDKMREYICNDDGWFRQDQWEMLEQYIGELQNQFTNNILIIDDDAIMGSDTDIFRFVVEKVQDYYGGGTIYVDEDGNIEDWYTIPSTESGKYRLARNIPEVVETVKEELEYREEHAGEDDDDQLYYNSQWYAGLNQKELWLAALNDWLEEDPSQIDWGNINKNCLVPIKAYSNSDEPD